MISESRLTSSGLSVYMTEHMLVKTADNFYIVLRCMHRLHQKSNL